MRKDQEEYLTPACMSDSYERLRVQSRVGSLGGVVTYCSIDLHYIGQEITYD